MAYWRISEKNNVGNYLILNESSILFADFADDASAQKAIEERTINKASIFNFKSIRSIVFIDSDNKIILNSKEKDVEDKTIQLENKTFTEIKTFLKLNFENTDIADYSIWRQISPKLISVGISVLITSVLYTTALSLQNGENISTSGRRGLFKRLFVGIADFLGPTGSLIVGGLITLAIVYFTMQQVKNPKQGIVFKVNKHSRVKIN